MSGSGSVDAPVRANQWPTLPYQDWQDTCATLHMWMQIVGKIRLAQMPWINHSWHVTLYTTSRGLTTSTIPYGSGLQIAFDFIGHQLVIETCEGASRTVALRPRSVADFYQELFSKLRELEIKLEIMGKPNEVETAIPFDQDETHASYDPEHANLYWRALVQAERVFNIFRARFIGKCSPVHFFWGAPDLAVTRFSGRTAPEHPGGFPNLPDRITREAYSHEVSSAGFWPGAGPFPPLFYSYAYPEPDAFSLAPARPRSATYNTDLHEFVLFYDDVRKAASPDEALLDFLQSTYEVAADLSGWDRGALEHTG